MRVVGLLCVLALICSAVAQKSLSISCPQDAVDVQNNAVDVQCNFRLIASTPITDYNAFASINYKSFSAWYVYPISGGSLKNGSVTDVDSVLTFRLPQYAPNGTYTVQATATGNGNYVTASATFTVSATVNDNVAPALVSLRIPDVNPNNFSSAFVQLVVEEFTKIASISVSSSDYITATYRADGSTNVIASSQSGNRTTLTLPLSISSATTAGIYTFSVTLCDIFSHCVYLAYNDLVKGGMQSSINVGSVTADFVSFSCPSGPYDVKSAAISVKCSLSVSFASGIAWHQIYANQAVSNSYYLSLSVADLILEKNVKNVTTNIMVTLKQYQPSGTYTVTFQASSVSGTIYSVPSYITVADTINDKQAPTLISLSAPTYDSASSADPTVMVSASDDYGLQSISVSSAYMTGDKYQLFASWNAPSGSAAPTSVSTTLSFSLSGAYLDRDNYPFMVTLYDIFGRKKEYSSSDLQSMGAQAQLNVTRMTSRPTLTGFYVPSIVKTSDDLYVKISAVSAKNNAVSAIAIIVTYSNGSVFTSTAWSSSQLLDMVTDRVISVVIPATTPAGIYTLSVKVTITDSFGNVWTYAPSDIMQAGFQATFTYARSSCGAGYYGANYPSSTASCTVCPVGTFSAGPGAFRCSACPPGKFSTSTGATTCNPCPAGTIGIGGSWACQGCPAGQYNPFAGQVSCLACPDGYTSTYAASACTLCPFGSYTTKGYGGCYKCAKGSYASGPAAWCTPCPAGTYANTTGSTMCTACPAGTFASGGFIDCTVCEGGKTGPIGSSSKLNCYN